MSAHLVRGGGCPVRAAQSQAVPPRLLGWRCGHGARSPALIASGLPAVSAVHLERRIQVLAAGARGRYSAGVARAVAAATRKAVRS